MSYITDKYSTTYTATSMSIDDAWSVGLVGKELGKSLGWGSVCKFRQWSSCIRGNHCQCLKTFGTWTSTGTSKWLSWEVGTKNSEWSQDPKACQLKTIRSQIEPELASIRAGSTTIDEVVMFLFINCLIIPTKSLSDMFFILSDQEATLLLVSPTCTTLTDGSFWIFLWT